MGRGIGSKGGNRTGRNEEADWLGGGGDGGDSCCGPQYVPREEKPRRKKKSSIDDELDRPEPKGIKWGPIAFLILIIAPAALPTILDVCGKLQTMGMLKLPSLSGSDNPYRPCLQEYYADWAPEKLGNLDSTLEKYTGREKTLFGILQRKYGKPVQTARCVPGKKSAGGGAKPKKEKKPKKQKAEEDE